MYYGQQHLSYENGAVLKRYFYCGNPFVVFNDVQKWMCIHTYLWQSVALWFYNLVCDHGSAARQSTK
jgi:hypothetical protein